jgi:tmRNA-binding protein
LAKKSGADPEEEPRRSIATNRRARFEFHILDQLEAGISLTGT